MGRLSQPNRQRIIDIARELKPHWQLVAREMKRKYRVTVAAKTCARTWNRWKETRSTNDRSRTGRPLKCTKRKGKSICAYARRNRFQTIGDYVEFARNKLRVRMTPKTVSAVLAREGLHRRVALRKPILSAPQREARVCWARRRQRFNIRYWKRIVFSDEKIFRSDNNRKSVFVTRSKGEKFKPCCIQPTFKHGIQVHAWAGVGWKGKTPIRLVRGNLNAAKYQQEIVHDIGVLCRQLVPGGRNVLFQQDKAPCHNARSTREFIANQRVDILSWPGNSPDLNIMENLWAEVVTRVRRHRTLPRNQEELWARVQQAWADIPLSTVQKLFNSMPARIAAVIKSKGGPTKY